jgi:phosphotransferase system enzyme I (PtsI)
MTLPLATDQVLRGLGVSSGIARGTAYVVTSSEHAAAPRRIIAASAVDGELARFAAALDQAEEELRSLRESVSTKIGPREADIFSAQAMLVRDPSFRTAVTAAVRDRHLNIEAAVVETVDRYTRTFDQISDAYLRERAADIRDIGRRVLSALVNECGPVELDVPAEAIVVTDELLPSTTAGLEMNRVRAFVTERGGKFSHAAILARSVATPAVVGVPEATTKIRTGDALIVDGMTGLVFVAPPPSVVDEYARLETEITAYRAGLHQLVDLPSVTLDGTEIELLANVSKFADTEAAFLYKAQGIGLYRTEFGFTVRKTPPTEDEQYEFLARAAERFHPRRIVFRLLDVGGDKMLPYLPLPHARNPSLAQRGIRLLLQHPEILRQQLRVFLRVSANHPISILLPVVGGVEEVRQTRAVLRSVQDELTAAGIPFDRDVPVGAMIEVPSAALIARALAREVDFFSLGTNDLVQYVLAADREDETVANYYEPRHPGVLQLIHAVTAAGRAAGRGVTICGEMAGDPYYTELLVGMGLRALSVAPGEMLAVKEAIRRIRLPEAESLAGEVLLQGSVAEVAALLDARRPAK